MGRMKYVTFSLSNDAVPRLGALCGDRIVELQAAAASKWRGPFPGTLLDLIGMGREAWTHMASLVGDGKAAPAGASHGMTDVRWLAPIPRPAKNIFCLGLNYVSHMEESSRARGREIKIPEVPVFFSKAPTSVNGPYDDIPWDKSITEQVDWEAELGVIVGKGGKNLKRGEAMDHVFGYTVINDVSARDVQVRHMQWFKGKSLDGSCPMGPMVITADEFGDPQAKSISLRVNGVTKQSATTADMIFPVSVILEFLSQGMTIDAGDIIATGTPQGVGLGRVPPEYLNDGDVVETEVEGIGTLRNRVVAVK
jgi:2-keto-4-pentenoate hydratase/2-oxohepta-3-ene-1,7-dioic acid hydratase in catechol pathway